jgi:integrase
MPDFDIDTFTKPDREALPVAHVFQTFDKNGNPHPRWKIQYVDWKGHKRKTTGYTSRTESEKRAHSIQSEQDDIKKGYRPAPKASDKARNYAETTAEYLAQGRAKGGRRGFGWAKDHAEKKQCALKWWADRLSLQTIQDIDAALVEGALRELLASGLAGKTVQGYSEALASFCDWCVSRQYLAADPLSIITAFNCTPKNPHRELAADEIQKLLVAAPAHRALLYRVALSTGYRQNELRSLTVGCLDLFGPSLPLAAEFCKDRRDARQPITRELAEELSALTKGKPANAPLLDMPKKETCSENLNRDFIKAGIRRQTTSGKATFHSFRVNYINAVVKTGADLKTIMTLARHSSATMSMSTYAKPDAQRLRECAEAVSESIKNTAAPILTQQFATGTEDAAVNTCHITTCDEAEKSARKVQIPVGILFKGLTRTDASGTVSGPLASQLGPPQNLPAMRMQKSGQNRVKQARRPDSK